MEYALAKAEAKHLSKATSFLGKDPIPNNQCGCCERLCFRRSPFVSTVIFFVNRIRLDDGATWVFFSSCIRSMLFSSAALPVSGAHIRNWKSTLHLLQTWQISFDVLRNGCSLLTKHRCCWLRSSVVQIQGEARRGFPRLRTLRSPLSLFTGTILKNQKRHDGTLWDLRLSLPSNLFFTYLMQVSVQSCS